MKHHPKELENVSSQKPFERYKYFIKKIADYEELWTLVEKNHDLFLTEIDQHILISLWTHEDFINYKKDEIWNNSISIKLSLDEFEEKIIPLIIKNNYLINVFPVYNKSGFTVNLDEFIRDLNEELKLYQ